MENSTYVLSSEKLQLFFFQAEGTKEKNSMQIHPSHIQKRIWVMGGYCIAERASFFLILLKSLQLFLSLERLQALEYFLHTSQQCEVLFDGRPGILLCCCSSTWPQAGCRYLRLPKPFLNVLAPYLLFSFSTQPKDGKDQEAPRASDFLPIFPSHLSNF